MPFISGSANSELSWDSFAQRSHDVNQWEPDPDSVPVAGGHPDRRFAVSPNPAASVITGSWPAPVAMGSWPAPVPRARGLPRAFVPSSATNGDESNLQEVKAPQSFPSLASRASPVENLRGTMETLSVKPSLGGWPTPTIVPGTTERPGKLSSASRPENKQGQLVSGLTTRSIPPHLRKEGFAGRASAVSTAPISEPPAETVYKTSSSEDSKSVSSPSLKSEAITGVTTEDQDLDAAITASLIDKVLIEGRKRCLNTRLILDMEDDLDEPVHMTPQELREMSDVDFERHFKETDSKHRVAWEANHRDAIGGTVSKPSLAFLQELERIRFERQNSSFGTQY